MLELEDFVELYLSASDEVKASIEKILTECQSQTEYPQEHFDKLMGYKAKKKRAQRKAEKEAAAAAESE